MADNQNNESKKGFWGFASNSFEKHPWISMFTITGVISGVFAGIKGIIEAIRRPKDSWGREAESFKGACEALNEAAGKLSDDEPKAEVIDITPPEEEKEEE